MVTRVCPHSVLNVADARHVESVEPDGSARVHRTTICDGQQRKKALFWRGSSGGAGEGASLGAAAIANTLADALAPFYASKGERKEKCRDRYPPV